MRKKYLDAIEGLPLDKVVKDRGTSFLSILDVFVHVLNVYRCLFEYAIKDNMKAFARIDDETFTSVADLRRYEKEVDSMVMNPEE